MKKINHIDFFHYSPVVFVPLKNILFFFYFLYEYIVQAKRPVRVTQSQTFLDLKFSDAGITGE